MLIDLLAMTGPNRGRLVPGIFGWTEGRLRLCLDLAGEQHPTTFDAPAGSRHYSATYQRRVPRATRPVATAVAASRDLPAR
jgi:hypothetical protein